MRPEDLVSLVIIKYPKGYVAVVRFRDPKRDFIFSRDNREHVMAHLAWRFGGRW